VCYSTQTVIKIRLLFTGIGDITIGHCVKGKLCACVIATKMQIVTDGVGYSVWLNESLEIANISEHIS